MKPDPTGITHSMATFEVGPERTVVVGDSWLDGMAARTSGVPFIGFRPRPGVLDERGVPYWTIVEELTQLLPVLTGSWPIPSPHPA
jgi:phosphoglycolate phosphatase-like HAD superfamily hydrolase